MFFSSPTSNITPAMTSVAMSRSDSRDSTSSNANYYTYAPTSAYTALVSASPTSAWPTSQALARTDSNASSTSTSTSSQAQSIAMRRDSSNSTWMPSPYRSCMSSFGAEPNSYLSDDDLLCPAEELNLPVENIPALAPKKELTTEEQIAFVRELQEKEVAANYPQAAAHYSRDADVRRRVVRFANQDAANSSSKSRRPSAVKGRQPVQRRGTRCLNGPQ
ncbi:uncharacterized protein A1O5_01457 [Cladophialophora psammophila CBS 110553]|uniref:Uncharacterized protein n=1 Tax=Cladophialophora psammophila CBS 110553 TaxID=1182543 RepID=W9X2R4_9EURO|nr:uncharacterized protein A1O5_01457 [Cladophialophora psammophila CBS 110553]EXJ74762.1 hypothetical protein A1O5_01457 [Cladophialophora psammophila CBS 110553]